MERRILGVFVAAVLTSAMGAPAFAADGPNQLRIKVGDLNLGSHAGAHAALNRIRGATREYCGVDPGSRALRMQAEARKCDARLTYMAVRKLDAPLVTAAYEGSRSQPAILFARR
jgi:UrcA family protein